MTSLEYLSSAESGGHGSTTSQNPRQNLGFHTLPVSKRSAPITKKSNVCLGKSRPNSEQNHLCLIQLMWLWRPVLFFCFGQILHLLKKFKNSMDSHQHLQGQIQFVHRRNIGVTPLPVWKRYFPQRNRDFPAWRWKAPRRGKHRKIHVITTVQCIVGKGLEGSEE